MDDIDTATVVDSLVLDPEWPIREADMNKQLHRSASRMLSRLSLGFVLTTGRLGLAPAIDSELLGSVFIAVLFEVTP